MALVAQIGLYVLVGACFVAVLVFLVRAVAARFSISDESFNVARLQARRKMMQSALGAIAFLVLGLIFFAVVLLFPFGSVENEGEETADDEGPIVVETIEDGREVDEGDLVEPTEVISATSEPATEEPTETPTLTIVPVTPTTEPTATTPPTAVPIQAVVNSPVVGLYVRETPAGEILERLEDGTAVTVLGEQQAIDELVWVLVESPNGFVGWVAQDFLLIEGTP